MTGRDSSNDYNSFVDDVTVLYTRGSGVYSSVAGGSNRFTNATVNRAGGHGFVVGFDTHVQGCIAGESEFTGFHHSHGMTTSVGKRAYWSGARVGNLIRHGVAPISRLSPGFMLRGVGHLVLTGNISQKQRRPRLLDRRASHRRSGPASQRQQHDGRLGTAGRRPVDPAGKAPRRPTCRPCRVLSRPLRQGGPDRRVVL
jgi:hypothetical protein